MDFASSPWLWDSGIPRPTFERDFARDKELDRGGIGPNITFTRGSQATYFTADGTLRFAPHNAIQNSEAVGATNGVIWSPSAFVGAGSIPQWASFRNFGSMEVVGSGTELGMRYVDVKISGTNTNPVDAGAQIIGFNAFDNCVASSGQTWTSSASIRLVDGSLTNVLLVYLTMQGRQADTTSTEAGTTTFTPSSTYQRVVATKTMTNASTARVSPDLTVLAAPSSTINLTFRIAAPQLERNATASDYIPTTGTANFDQPRFDHDPATGASRGLLIEEARTNVIPASSALTNATYWSVDAGVTRTANAAVAPDGTNTATRVVFTTANEALYRNATSDVGGVGTFTATFFVKAGAAGQIGATINVGTGNGTDGFTDVAVTLTDQWQRVSATKTTALSADRYISVNNSNSATATDVLVWGAQLEAGAFPTSYIPTTSAAVTRSADSAVVTPISSFYNQSEGTLFAEVRGALNSSGLYPSIASISDGTSSNQILWFYNLDGSTSIGCVANGLGVSSAVNLANPLKCIVAVSAASSRAALDGALLGSVDDTVTMPAATRLDIGQTFDGASQMLGGHIRKIAYYPRRLSNTLLQQLTT